MDAPWLKSPSGLGARYLPRAPANVANKSRHARIDAIKRAYRAYLADLSDPGLARQFELRFKRLTRDVQGCLRKQPGSQNTLKLMPRMSRLVYGLHADMKRLRVPLYDFSAELEIINAHVIAALEALRTTGYRGQCCAQDGKVRYGETILNCYLDVFISLTIRDSPREIGENHGWLRNPLTGQALELDVYFERFALAFEFQGEPHYWQSPRARREALKDQQKLRAMAALKRFLIPVNVSQLQQDPLAHLIVNTVKDGLGLHEIMVGDAPPSWAAITPRQRSHFALLVQRLVQARVVYAPALAWLDQHGATYIAQQQGSQPVSSTSPAPRQFVPGGDLAPETLNHHLPRITRVRGRRTE